MRKTFIVHAICVSHLLVACPTGSESGGGGTSNAVDGGPGSTTYNKDGCLLTSATIRVENIDKLDLLLVVDNSSSMAGEQRSLKQEFPNLIRALTTGYRFNNDFDPFPPLKDIHIGVVSTDMGVPGVEMPPSCHADGGDDGKLQNTPHGENCDSQYPLWLQFIGDSKNGAVTMPDKFASDVGCIATLGTSGCDFEQQLEAPFKALMPKVLTDAAGKELRNPYRFIATDEPRTWGRGDQPMAQGGNHGFIRNAQTEGLSLIAILLVTDEEDCSVKETNHLKPNASLPEDSPYRTEDINLRCFKHKEFLYDLKTRYLTGFQALRPGNESLVLFAAITGVPPDLVDQDVLSHVDFDDQAQRDAFYASILGDPRMQEEIDPTTMPGSGQGNLRPSCVRHVSGETTPSTAYPPRRIVELARLFGSNGIVQSICQDDFGPALSTVVNRIAGKLGESCLPGPLVRKTDGLIACDVIWELPSQVQPGAPTPTRCEALPFLGPVSAGQSTMNANGGANCKVRQLAVPDVTHAAVQPGEGWYYDDFTSDVAKVCKAQRRQRVAFTAGAKPPTGVTVKLECETSLSLSGLTSNASQSAAGQPVIGSSCAPDSSTAPSGDAACVATHADGSVDTSLFCAPSLALCVKRCTAGADCPSGWMCDQSPEALNITSGRAYCVDPKCGR